MKILLLEDDLLLQRATTRLLRAAFGDHITVRAVRMVVGAIEALVMEPVDLVVSDFEVLDGTADQLLDWVRTERPDLLPRFVFFSGKDGLDKLHDKVIEKGCMPDEFIAQLHKLVGAPT